MMFTLGVKNMFGCVSAPRKALWHLKAGEDQKAFSPVDRGYFYKSPSFLDRVGWRCGDGRKRAGKRESHSLGLIMASPGRISASIRSYVNFCNFHGQSLPTNQVALEDWNHGRRI